MEDWALIRRLAAEGGPKAAIAGRLKISRTKVLKAVASQGPPTYRRKPGRPSFTPVEARVRQLLAETPDMPATVLAERVGWTGSVRRITVATRNSCQCKPALSGWQVRGRGWSR